MRGALGAALVVVSALAFSAPASAASSSAASRNDLTLLSAPNYLTPGQPYVLRLTVPGGSARHGLYLDVSLYRCLGSRSAFDQTLQATPAGSSVSSGPLAVSELPTDPQNTSGVDLVVPVAAGDTPPVGIGPFVAHLVCPVGYYGVYPVRVQLLNASGTVLGNLTTYLVYSPPANPQPLRLALVVPVSAAVSRSGTRGATSMPSSQASALSQLVAALSDPATSHVPLTIVPSPSTLASLAAATPRSKQTSSAISFLGGLAGSAEKEVLCGPFVSIDPSAFVAAGLTSELIRQVREGEAMLRQILHAPCAGRDTWVAHTTLTQSAIAALGALGYDHVVVPQSALAGPTPSYNIQRLFDLGNGRSQSVLAAMADPGLATRLQPGPRADSALYVHRLIAELEQIYFDAPNTTEPRGVVAVAPANWGDDPSFVSALLSALSDNPLVKPVTLADLFAPVPVGVPVGGRIGGVVQPETRRPASANAQSTLDGASVRATRARVDGFAAAVSSQSARGAFVAQAIDQLLLESESDDLSSAGRRSLIEETSAALDDQLDFLSVNAGQIRLASNAALVPITVSKRVSYPMSGVLEVTSDKLVFPEASQSPGSLCRSTRVETSQGRSSFYSLCVVDHSTNVIYVDMRTRVAGDFRVSVTFTSPTGGLTLASAQLTVRSTSLSAVSIALSVAAAAVLLAWWGRTVWRKRHGRDQKRPAHARGLRTA
jgi:hypothetical protein